MVFLRVNAAVKSPHPRWCVKASSADRSRRSWVWDRHVVSAQHRGSRSTTPGNLGMLFLLNFALVPHWIYGICLTGCSGFCEGCAVAEKSKSPRIAELFQGTRLSPGTGPHLIGIWPPRRDGVQWGSDPKCFWIWQLQLYSCWDLSDSTPWADQDVEVP